VHVRRWAIVRIGRGASVLVISFAAAACSDTTSSTPVLDARIIAFVSDSANPYGTSIFTMHADGSHKTPLTSPNHHDGSPAWSPNGSSITFETDRQPAGIWIMNADGSNQRPLLTSSDFYSPLDLHWSPDGQSIAFVAFTAANPGEIMIADADGANAHRLTTSSTTERWPSWSPDGSRIAFMAQVDSGGSSIFVVNLDGTGRRRLTYGTDLQPEWSPDGARIAFSTFDNDGRSQISVVKQDGSDRHALTGSDGEFDPAWSADGRQVAYDGPSNDPMPGGPIEIYLVNSNGSAARQITSFGSVAGAFSISFAPAWKPTP